ncbi:MULTISPECIES: amino acid ABC transporter permease [Ramlibacter]|uniref:ABC transporter permease subunit n=1 Tax=Ramlibacter pinisoli TaxID=2682844 RepID=A0A6N8INH8_9BURK|nr:MULTISPECIES: amino acid ABC transporter permease [Ramlibacter]MVQ28378.1 ABC transporter permease subunit [Ramlibacter pinisoli]
MSPVPARAAPAVAGGAWQRWQRGLFATPLQSALSVLLLSLLAWGGARLVEWAVLHAVWSADADSCQAARGIGACWGVVAEKGRLVLLGRYPADATWRPVTATLVLLAGVVATMSGTTRRPWLLLAWPAGLAVFIVLMGGGAGLPRVPTDLWGGLPLTVFLTAAALLLAFPIAVLLALGRRSTLPAVRTLCAGFIELVRGVPLISVLFMASFMLPLLLSPGRSPDVLVRVVAGLALFAAAYMAEVVRGGLQSIPRTQSEAAASLGLGWWQAQRKIVLPQALGAVVPALVNNCLSLFKDTSLVTIVSLYELTGSLALALGSDPVWRPFKIEAYLFIAAVYFAFCFAMSSASRRLEVRLARSRAR